MRTDLSKHRHIFGIAFQPIFSVAIGLLGHLAGEKLGPELHPQDFFAWICPTLFGPIGEAFSCLQGTASEPFTGVLMAHPALKALDFCAETKAGITFEVFPPRSCFGSQIRGRILGVAPRKLAADSFDVQ